MALYAATLLLLGGCRKDLCYDHPDHAFSVQVNLTATWEQEWERSYQTDWQSVCRASKAPRVRLRVVALAEASAAMSLKTMYSVSLL